jgi:uncharacterized protein YecE (DUF72 family)
VARDYIGTSGWAYKEWGKKFFPKEVPQREQLGYLAKHFNTVELNASFYRIQPASNFEKWYKETPADFVFAVKVSRYITHIKKLTKFKEPWDRLFENTPPLKGKRGPFLVQFPPSFRGNEEQIGRIDDFLAYAKKSGRGLRFALEFRCKECFSDAMQAVVKKHKVALVFPNSSKYPEAPDWSYANFVYFRLHGPRKMFASSYKDDELKAWAARMRQYHQQGKDVYVYFNNDMHAHAPENAKLLQKFLKIKDRPL